MQNLNKKNQVFINIFGKLNKFNYKKKKTTFNNKIQQN